ncbi:sensor histidine kinase [Aureimonas populi]|uniref:histidine kinase n=1 Tax=Aureimonas populi TaxID=1701758 RepID=A0ABW5CK01_9HYPH|nr:ATP-binding protein [Aureimonas populi]
MASSPSPASPLSNVPASAASRWGRALLVLLALGGFALAVEGVGRFAEGRVVERLREEAHLALPLAGSALRAEIDRQRAVPLVLAQESTVRATLEMRLASSVAATNEKLRRLATGTRASVLYLIDANGLAVAASNFGEADSFVGSSYRFRRYFTQALEEGRAEQYALGTVSGRPGLYIAERIGTAEVPIGVVVAKVELGTVEGEWASTGRPTYVTDAEGVVLATSVPAWRFLAEREIGEGEAAAIRERLQSGEAPLSRLPVRETRTEGLLRAAPGGGAPGRFAGASQALAGGPEGWQLHLLAPADAAIRQEGALARLLAALALALAAIAGFASWRRRQREGERRAALARTAAELETRVAARTAELTQANARLQGEIAERAAAESRVLKLRDDLAQANRLATLGQITAGVAHEINQPLAAIRAYAENAGRFLERGEPRQAGANMGHVVQLTERIDTITEALRSVARRAPGRRRRMDLSEALDGALLMLASRIREAGVTLERSGVTGPLPIEADRIRLEQVLVNLLRNALDALGETPCPVITLETGAGESTVGLTIRDNGPGLAPDALERLFTPFSTTKPNGLGLGLVISQDIVSEMGGRILARNAPEGGAIFTVELRRAGP